MLESRLADAQTKLVLGPSTFTTDPCHQSALIFAKEFERLTKGQSVVEVYPADQLGKEQTQALRAGTQHIQQWVLAGGMLIWWCWRGCRSSRAIFDRPLAWSEEGVRYVMTWTVFLAAAWWRVRSG